jgi:hypothetical protein
MRVALSVLATAFLLVLCSGVMLAVLNLQGYVPQAHSWIYMPALAELTMPGTAEIKLSCIFVALVLPNL